VGEDDEDTDCNVKPNVELKVFTIYDYDETTII
jgi:hypothetical protein